MSAPSSSKRRWIRWLIITAVILALLYGVEFAAQSARTSARRQERMSRLYQVGLALACVEMAHGRLPPAVRVDEAGKPLSSWRFQLSPFLEGTMIDVDFDKPWDDPVNREMAKHFVEFFGRSSPGDSPTRSHSNIVAVTGPGTAFDGQRECRLGDLDDDTILVVEVADSGVHWMAPGDLSIERVPDSLVGGLEGDGLCVLFADGAVWFLRPDAPLDTLKRFFTIEGAKQYDREKLLGPYAVKRSAGRD